MVSNQLGAERTWKIPFTPVAHPSEQAVPAGCEVLTTSLSVLSVQEADNLLLAQVRYDEHVALRNLQALFENGELELLGW